MKRYTPLKRHTALVRRTRLRRVSRPRAKQLRTYSVLRKAFLRAHPYCQVWLRENGYTERQAIAGEGVVIRVQRFGSGTTRSIVQVPFSEQVHHIRKRRGAALLDESAWLAVSARAHEQIENNKAWARERGYLANF